MSPATSVFPVAVPMTLWRDRAPAAMPLPGMHAGDVDWLDEPLGAVERMAARGVQFAQLRDIVDLDDDDGGAAVAALVVVREFTSHGIAVDWTIRMPAGGEGWRLLSHLHPPMAVLCDTAADSVTALWRDSFHAAKCGYRRGPGFIEIRDRRNDSFRRLVIKSAQRDQAIRPLLRGMPAVSLDETVAARFMDMDLLHRVGRFVWWTPYLIRRWPLSTTIP